MPPPQAILNLGFENAEWNLTSQEKYLLIKDPRSRYQIYHPWDISKYGDFAVTSTQVTIPEGWQNSVFLNLYASDTYVSEGWEHTKPRWIHTYAVYPSFRGSSPQAGQVRYLRSSTQSGCGRDRGLTIRSATSDSH